MTKFVILAQVGDGGWRERGAPLEAHSGEAAIRKHAADAGTFVAVPARSWKPVTVEVETTRQIKLAPVSAGEPKGEDR
jgi:hypothetical protein